MIHVRADMVLIFQHGVPYEVYGLHDLAVCEDSINPSVDSKCPGCQYMALVERLLDLHRPTLHDGAVNKGGRRNAKNRR